MNTPLFNSICKPLLLAGIASPLFLLPLSLSGAQIVANFVDGGSNTSPVTNKVDAFRGMAGNGWTSAWVTRNNYGTGSMSSIAVVNDGTLWSGNRLKLTPSNNATGTGFGINRSYSSYENVDVTKRITISFQVSIDSLGTFLHHNSNEIFIGENGTDSVNRTSSTTWYIQAFGGNDADAYVTRTNYTTAKQMQWNIGTSGSDFIPTGITLRENVLYSFTLEIDPSTYTYSVKLSDGEGGMDDFYHANIAFRSNQVLGRTVVVGQQYTATEGSTFSFGNFAIIPEPGTYALLLVGGIAGAFIVRRRNVA